MKLCSKLLIIAILTVTCFTMISCAGPTNTSSTYKDVSISLAFYPICNGCFISGAQIGIYYGVNPPGAGGITGPQICSPVSNTCLINGSELCTTATQTCVTGGGIEMPQGGGSGGCIELETHLTNAPLNPTYKIIPAPIDNASQNIQSNVGYLSGQNGPNIFYCEPSAPPVYSGAQLAQAQQNNIPMGFTEVQVTNPADPNDPSKVVTSQLYFAYQTQSPPSGVSAGLLPGGNVVVPLGGTYQFTGYIIGTNGYVTPTGSVAPTGGCVAPTSACIPAYQVNYNVNGVLGGAGPYGTISSTGLYTAPSTYPIVSGSPVKTASITATPAAYASSSIVSATTTVTFP